MSLPLTDFRCKVTPEVDAVLEAVHRSTGKDKSEIARDVLHKWAVVEIGALMILLEEMTSKGLMRDYEGGSGK